MVGPFSGGLLVEDVCGILTSALTVLGIIFTSEVAHQSPIMIEASREYISEFKKNLGSSNCKNLKLLYRDPIHGCNDLIIDGGILLESLVKKYKA